MDSEEITSDRESVRSTEKDAEVSESERVREIFSFALKGCRLGDVLLKSTGELKIATPSTRKSSFPADSDPCPFSIASGTQPVS